MHDTDKVEESLMVLFFGLVFSIALPPHSLKIFLSTPLIKKYNKSAEMINSLDSYTQWNNTLKCSLLLKNKWL